MPTGPFTDVYKHMGALCNLHCALVVVVVVVCVYVCWGIYFYITLYISLLWSHAQSSNKRPLKCERSCPNCFPPTCKCSAYIEIVRLALVTRLFHVLCFRQWVFASWCVPCTSLLTSQLEEKLWQEKKNWDPASELDVRSNVVTVYNHRRYGTVFLLDARSWISQMLVPVYVNNHFVSVHMGVRLKNSLWHLVVKVDILVTTRSYAKKLKHTKFIECIEAANISEHA